MKEKHIMDPHSENRKKDHINLALDSQTPSCEKDYRFIYDPILSGHPRDNDRFPETEFLSQKFAFPIWVSSMTGGTERAKMINANLARLCKEYKLGMGLGSCRPLLYDDERLEDFTVRHLIGDRPLYANLGIAQVEELINVGDLNRVISNLIDKLEADGLILHVNPLQEWLQPEGDRYNITPLEAISRLLEIQGLSLIVKEVGQGMGKDSLRELLKLPIQAIDFGAHGGTNFSKLELLRRDDKYVDEMLPLVKVGHSAVEMSNFVNELLHELGDEVQCHEVIVSGGIKNFLDGYFLINHCQLNAIYGQASTLLKHAIKGYDELQKFMNSQIEGLKVANAMLKINPTYQFTR